MQAAVPLDVVNAAAPIRICDNGGWTDTWFAGHGKVFNIAVAPFVEAEVKTFPLRAVADRVVLRVVNFGDRYGFEAGAAPGLHPLLEAAVAEVGVPDDLAIEISIDSKAPVGCSAGTSAAAVVALIGALDALTSGRMTPLQVARAAHRVEVDRLGLQSGVQDQLCAAFGGVNFIEISSYPEATVSPVEVPEDTWWELDRRLVMVYMGRPHTSSDLHDRVIADISGRPAELHKTLEELRSAAQQARDAVSAGDLVGLGESMKHNTEAQRRLDPELVSETADEVIDLAATHGALGWKVNGAGGQGGSLTLLAGADMAATAGLLSALADDGSRQVVPTSLSRSGLRVWRSTSP